MEGSTDGGALFIIRTCGGERVACDVESLLCDVHLTARWRSMMSMLACLADRCDVMGRDGVVQ